MTDPIIGIRKHMATVNGAHGNTKDSLHLSLLKSSVVPESKKHTDFVVSTSS